MIFPLYPNPGLNAISAGLKSIRGGRTGSPASPRRDRGRRPCREGREEGGGIPRPELGWGEASPTCPPPPPPGSLREGLGKTLTLCCRSFPCPGGAADCWPLPATLQGPRPRGWCPPCGLTPSSPAASRCGGAAAPEPGKERAAGPCPRRGEPWGNGAAPPEEPPRSKHTPAPRPAAFGGMRPARNVPPAGLLQGGGRAGVRQELAGLPAPKPSRLGLPPAGQPAKRRCGEARGPREPRSPSPPRCSCCRSPSGGAGGGKSQSLPGAGQPVTKRTDSPSIPPESPACRASCPSRPPRGAAFGVLSPPAALAPTRVSSPAAHGQPPGQPSGRVSRCLQLRIVIAGPIRPVTLGKQRGLAQIGAAFGNALPE